MEKLKKSLLDTRLRRKERQKSELKEAIMQKSIELDGNHQQKREKKEQQVQQHKDIILKQVEKPKHTSIK